MASPSIAVPRPGGRPTPSGPMLMSHAAMSAGAIGCPNCGAWARDADAIVSIDMQTTMGLSVNIAGLPHLVNAPACDGGLHLNREHELPSLLILEQDRVFRGLIFAHRRTSSCLEPAQPLHVHVALKARQQQPHWIAVRRPHSLAVLIKTDERIIHRL